MSSSAPSNGGSSFNFPVKSEQEFYVILCTLAMCFAGLLVIVCIFLMLRRKFPSLYWRTSLKTMCHSYNVTALNESQMRHLDDSRNEVDTTAQQQPSTPGIPSVDENVSAPALGLLNDFGTQTHLETNSDDHESFFAAKPILDKKSAKNSLRILITTLLASNRWIYHYLGFDTLVLISTMRLLLLLSSICSFFNLVCVIPTNIISNTTIPINTTNIISRIGISNIPKGSNLLWVHLVLLYSYSILMYLLIYYYWKMLVYWKQRYFIDNSALHRSFIIQNLPADMINEQDISNFLKKYINLNDKNTILYVFQNSFHLMKHMKECDQLLFKLAEYRETLLRYHLRVSESKLNPQSPLDTSQLDVDKIKEYLSFISGYHEYVDCIHHIREEVDKLENVPFAFVSFADIETAHTLAISDINTDINTQNCIVAPEPHGIQYRNFIHSNYTRLTLKIIVWISTLVFVMFWTIPFGLISKLSNSINYPQFSQYKIPTDLGIFLQSVIRSIIPMMLLMIFYLVLPFIMHFLSIAEGHISKMLIDISVFTKFSIFHIINTYFVFLISETLLIEIQTIITQPFSLSERLVKGLPNQANFFTIYIVFFTHVVNPFELLQFVPLIKYLYMSRKHSKFQMDVCLKPMQPNYPHMYSRLLYIFGIGLSQSLISPFLTIAWNIYFFSAYVTYTFLELFINRRTYSYKGLFWISTLNWMTVYLIIFQLMMIGLFALKDASQINFVAIPLPIFTMILHMLIKTLFTSKYLTMNLETLRKIPEASKVQLEAIKKNYDIREYLPKKGSLSMFSVPKRFRRQINHKLDLRIFRQLELFCKQLEDGTNNETKSSQSTA